MKKNKIEKSTSEKAKMSIESKNDLKKEIKSKGIWTDPRFAHLVNDPRFKHLPQSHKKVKIDKRFQSMFNDDKFKVKYTIDKYGRKTNTKSSSEDLKKYYDLKEDSSSNNDESDNENIKSDKSSKLQEQLQIDDSNSDDEEIADDIKSKLRDETLDYARGMAVMTDSSTDEESSEEEDELFIEHVWGELDRDAPRTEESTNRLAVCNMDWDRIRAIDIMVLCSSFLPSGGIIKSVTIYPSEFGKERMAEEEKRGPQELREYKKQQEDEFSGMRDESDEEGSDYHMEKLRQYQLNRLKYYYAVIECDSVSTADKLYIECDGLEYESTATKFDLRFIPDNVSFDDEPKDKCLELPDMSKYQPRLFTTTALQQAKVELTWDENDIDRKELNEKLISGKLNEVSDIELKKYIACSSEEESNETDIEKNTDDESNSDDSISKYKSLLDEIKIKENEKKKSKIEREMTWGIGDTKPEKSNQDKKGPELTPFEKIIEKKKLKQKARKEERKQKFSGKSKSDDDSESEDDIPVGVDMSDPYFAEEFANGEYEELKPKSKNSKQASQDDSNSDINSDEEKRKTAELALLLDDDDDEKSHFSLKKIQDNENETKTSKKRRKKLLRKSKSEIEASKKEIADNFTINTMDNRFSAIYSSHLFNIDPTDPHFKKTKGMEAIIDEKLKKRKHYDDETVIVEDNMTEKKKKKDVAVSMLVKSIKRKVDNKN